jgi:DHA1 family tetracycline resistance protein-like MFS transporter
MAGAALILPILPLFAERQFGMHPAVISLLVSSYFMAVFFAGPYLGQLSDRYGRVPLLAISQLGSALSFFMMAGAGSVAMLFAARLLDGITGGNIIIAQAYITDISPREKRTEALGYIFAVFGLGFVIGPALGGVLSAWLGARMPFVIAGAAALFTSVMSWRLLDETVERRPKEAPQAARIRLSLAEVAANLPLVLILVVAFLGQFGLGMVQSSFALYGQAVIFAGASDEVTNLGVGLLLGVVGLGQFFTQVWLIGPLKRRFGDARLVILGTLIRTIGLALYAVVFSPWIAALAGLLFAVGTGLMMPPLQSLATRTVGDSIRGAVLGVYQSSVSLAIIISTAVGGVLFAANPTLPFWTGAALALIGAVPGFSLFRLAREDRLQQAPGPAD